MFSGGVLQIEQCATLAPSDAVTACYDQLNEVIYMDYIIDCLRDHIAGMKYRESVLREEILIKSAELKLLEKERINLELGTDNWLNESQKS